MRLELKLIKDATLKPDAILEMIAEKFGFSLGIPKHEFNEEIMQTSVKMYYKGESYQAMCALSKVQYYSSSAFFYEYLGPSIEKENIKEVSYTAHVIENFISCKGKMQRFMVIRSRETPDWFPVK